VTAGQVLGITVHDHVVVGQGSYVSMRTEGLAFRKNGGKR